MEGRSKIRLGTSAWTYADWRGVMYPESLPQHQWLSWYARFFDTVEVDSTFYHAPTPKVSAHWDESTPEHFRFTLKVPRLVTHELRLREARPALEHFLAGVAPLRGKVGCLLVQLPASFRPTEADEKALRQFVGMLPTVGGGGWPFAIEFRDPAWARMPKVVHWLQDHGVCWAWTDTEPYNHQAEGAFEWLPQCSDLIYIRLLGDLSTKYHRDGKRQVERYDHLFWKRNRSLRNWAMKVRHHLEESRAVYLFAANHFEGCSPMTAARLARLLDLPNTLPDLEASHAPPPPDQLSLF